MSVEKEKTAEIWTTREVKNYLIDTSKAVLDRYGSDFTINVKVIFNPKDNIAWTSFNTVTLNAGCSQVQKIMRTENQFLYLKGLLSHELSHIIYMDKQLFNRYKMSLMNGMMYPFIPDCSDETREQLLGVLKNKRSSIKLAEIAFSICNTVEDGYGENTYLVNFYGSLIEGLKYMRQEFYNDLPLAVELEKDFLKGKKYEAIMNVMLQYALYYKVKGEDESLKIIEALEEIKPLIQKSLTTDFMGRLKIVNEIIILLWIYIYPIVNEDNDEEEKDENQKNDNEQDNNSNQDQNGDKQTNQNQNGDEQNHQEQSGNKQTNQTQNGDEQNNQDGNDKDFSSNGDNYSQRSKKPEMGEGNSRNLDSCPTQALPIPSDTNEQISSDIIREILDVLEGAKNEVMQVEAEKKNAQLMQAEANNGTYPGCKIFINRSCEVTQDMIDAYDNYRDVLNISKRMQREILQQLQDRRKGGKRTNLYLGRKVEIRNLLRNDGKYFYNYKLPQMVPRIVVSMVIDESGSMNSSSSNGQTRIYNARQTAIILEDFCRNLGFPISIIGSTADYIHHLSSELTVYCQFDQVTKRNLDRYRLTKISAKSANRDGAALNFAYEGLKKRDEEIKILFIISDGKPNAMNYGGQPAIEELRRIHDKCKKSGIVTFAAAVGEDKEKIESIYGDSFLDISNIEAMPKVFIEKIKKFIKR